MSSLERKLSHSKAAYDFAIKNLPDLTTQFPITKSGFCFEKASQIESMVIELGWSFFCRYEGCLEAYIKTKKIKLTKKMSLKDWLISKGVDIPDCYNEGLNIYRQIRNKLHHEDGATLDGINDDEEIHLLPTHMANFYSLFIWCGEQIENKC